MPMLTSHLAPQKWFQYIPASLLMNLYILPDDWLERLSHRWANALARTSLPSNEKHSQSVVFTNLQKHTGEQSTYAGKLSLQTSLQRIYCFLEYASDAYACARIIIHLNTSLTTPHTSRFHSQLYAIDMNLAEPTSLDGFLAIFRNDLLDGEVRRRIEPGKEPDVSLLNTMRLMANKLGYGTHFIQDPFFDKIRPEATGDALLRLLVTNRVLAQVNNDGFTPLTSGIHYRDKIAFLPALVERYHELTPDERMLAHASSSSSTSPNSGETDASRKRVITERMEEDTPSSTHTRRRLQGEQWRFLTVPRLPGEPDLSPPSLSCQTPGG